jgi:hypothetical protein
MVLTHILVGSDLTSSVTWHRGPTADKPEVTFPAPVANSPVDHSFTIPAGDVQQAYTTLLERGAKFPTAPSQREHETRCFFRDLDGHLFGISQV